MRNSFLSVTSKRVRIPGFLLACGIFTAFVTGTGTLSALPWLPPLHSQVRFSYCEDPEQDSILIQPPNTPGTSLAVQSIPRIRDSIKNYLATNDPHGILLQYRPPSNPEQWLQVRILGGVDYNRNKDEDYLFLYKGLKFRSQITNHLTAQGYWWAGHLTDNSAFAYASPLIDSWTQADDGIVYIDNLRGNLTYQDRILTASLGRGKLQIGNNISGSIILNDTCNDYGYLSTVMHFGTLQLTFMHAAMISDSLDTQTQRITDKFLALHKLQWTPSHAFSAFVGEEIVYGNRSIDINYVLPPVFWRIIEHNLSDRDNVLIFGGLTYHPMPAATIYQNLLFDEFSQSKLFTDWWGNKYASQTGISYELGRETKETGHTPCVSFEFTAVRPWTYTHYLMWNKFSNDSRPLGYPVGSNCISYTVELGSPIISRLYAAANASYTRQGGTGNQYYLNYMALIPDIDKTQTRWLEGGITDTMTLKVMLEWKPLQHHFLRLGTTITKVDDQDTQTEWLLSYRTEF